MKKLAIILSAVALAGCFTKKKGTTTATVSNAPTQADVDRSTAKFPGYTLAELNDGKALYEANCGTCHALVRPAAQSEDAWRRIVPDMVQKVNKRGMVLDAQKEDRILKYVITMSNR